MKPLLPERLLLALALTAGALAMPWPAVAQEFNPYAGREATRPASDRVIVKLRPQPQAAGRYRVDLSLPRLASGTYFYRLQVGKLVRERKMVLLK